MSVMSVGRMKRFGGSDLRKVLFIGQLWDGGTCGRRMRELQRLGLDCVPFDTTPYAAVGSRLERSLLHRFHVGRGALRLNSALLGITKSASFDAVWVDKGVFIHPDTLRALREASRLRLAIHYTPDAQILDNRSRHFLRGVPIYDLVVTTKPFEVEAYEKLGARSVLLVLQGFGANFLACDADAPTRGYRTDVCFIGHCEPHYAKLLEAVASLGCDLGVWGPNWVRFAKSHAWARAHVRGDGVWSSDYPRTLRQARIALGFLTKRIPETTTTRSFEIPAAGTFMLAERTDDHLALFEEGAEAEFFATADELTSKIRHYLENDGARETIARAGRERCLASGYGDAHQIGRILDRVGELLAWRIKSSSQPAIAAAE